MSIRRSERLKATKVEAAKIEMNKGKNNSKNEVITNTDGICEDVGNNSATSHVSLHLSNSSVGARSVRSTNNTTIHRQKLELQLEYARKKKEKEQEILDLELALQLAQIEENNEHEESMCSKKSNISNWVKENQNYTKFNADMQTQFKEELVPDLNQIMSRNTISKKLPQFNGDPIEWPYFISQYRNSTRICGFSDEENQHRLQNCLQGKAKDTVKSLLILPQNVNKVIETLEKRFGRPEYIISLLMERVKKLPLIKDEQINLLIDFSDAVNNLIYTLQTLNEDDHLRNPILLQELLNKLPTNYKMMWAKYMLKISKSDIKLVKFKDWLEEQAEAACHLRIPKFLEDKFDNSKVKSFKHNSTLVTTNKNISNKICSYCTKGNHYLSKCPNFISIDIDKRWEFITSKGICFSCLLSGHRIATCKNKKKCNIDGCVKPHHSLLHKIVTFNKLEINNDANCHISQPTNKILLKILPVRLVGNNNNAIETYALLDDASTVTLIDNDIAMQLNLDGPTHPLYIQWTNNETNQQDDSKIVNLTISGENNKPFYLRHVRTIKGLSLPTQTINFEELSKMYPYILKEKTSSILNAKPTILIGQDNWPLLLSRKAVYGPWFGPVLTKTLLGWVIHGNTEKKIQLNHRQFTCHAHEKDDIDILHDMVKEQWKIESFGVKPLPIDTPMSKEDVRAQSILEATLKRLENRYEIGLLWKNDNIQLPESKSNALKRLYSTERKMDKDNEYAKAYCDKIEDFLEKGYLRKLTFEEAKISNSKIWYLPHFGVVNPNKPGKLRIVFDAAAKSNGFSLNDYLLTGPDLYNSLQTILLNFRIKKIAFLADIKEMFLQVRVIKNDHCAQRLLWRGMDRHKSPDVYEIQVVFFGSTCGPCLAQEVRNKNAYHFKKEYPEAAKAILKHHYMDDYLGGADTEEEAIKLINDVITVHKMGGFIICNWISNSMNVLRHIDHKLTAIAEKNLSIESESEMSSERILGLWWNPRNDNFTYSTKFHKIDKDIINGKRRPTKREVLKVVMSIFDPLGFVAHFIIQGKILLQEIWRSGIFWDDEITDNLDKKWRLWLDNLKKINTFNLSRQYFKRGLNNCSKQLHVFCDASENAYAAVAYLRCKYKDDCQVSFICAKTRVSPLKPQSIPRLELQAALMGARLGTTLKNALEIEIDSYIYWTDSKTVLHWIKSEARRFKVFVAHRVGEIQELTDIENWKYIRSKENVADEATKRFNIETFSMESRWLSGPKFLQCPPNDWPTENNVDIKNVTTECLEERNEFVATIIIRELCIPTPERFSKWNRILRSTAWMLRFINRCRNPSWKNKNKTTFEIEPEEITAAENLLFRRIQMDSFYNEIIKLKEKKNLPKSSRLYCLSCILDKHDLIRLDGRLYNAQHFDEYLKKPVILDPKHWLTKLLIHNYHDSVNHHGQETVMNNLRQKFWILNMRQAVKKSWRDCQVCKNRRVMPKIPLMGQLPTCRIEPTIRAFIKTGIDYFGPIEITVKRSHDKRYGVIFTCMTTRAIHLEIAQDLSTDSFIHVLRQFGCRRGFPEEIFCDNGTNFKGAERELNESIKNLNQNEITKFCTMKKIKWNFNPPLSPHMGGTWERLIQSVKKSLREVLKERFPQEYVLRTLFAEIENILNSRPLTHVSLDCEDAEALTPNHFLIGPSYAATPYVDINDSKLYLLNKWKAAQRLADLFWKRWTREYVPTLINRKKWCNQQKKQVETGDIVVIVDSECPRNSWPKGKIIATYPARDGNVRIVDVKTDTGVYRRSVKKLCVLDIEK